MKGEGNEEGMADGEGGEGEGGEGGDREQAQEAPRKKPKIVDDDE